MADPALAAFEACQNSIPVPAPQDIVKDQGAALSSMMQAMGIRACTSSEVEGGVLPYLKTVDLAFSTGCEQLAVMSTVVQQTQDVLQCSVNSTSMSSSTFVMAQNNINVVLSGQSHVDCLTVQQNIQARIASYSDFGTVVQQKFGTTINDMVKSMATTVQNASKDITTPQGQKDVKAFVQQLSQSANASQYTAITQSAINNFQASNNFTLTLTEFSFIGAAFPNQVTKCVTINQNIIMQVLAQTIMTNSLTNVFKTDEASKFVQQWVTSQTSKAKAEPLSDLGVGLIGALLGLLLIGALAVGLFMLLKNGGNNSVMGTSSNGGSPGSRGKIIAIVLVVLGVLFFVLGAASLGAGFSTILGVIGIIVGLVMVALGGYLVYRSEQIEKNGGVTPKAESTSSEAATEATPEAKPAAQPAAQPKLAPKTLPPPPRAS